MGVRKVVKQMTVCDLCGRECACPSQCDVCERDYCSVCEAIIAGCVHQPDVCRDCGNRKDVNQIVDKAAESLSLIVKERYLGLRALPKKEPPHAQ